MDGFVTDRLDAQAAGVIFVEENGHGARREATQMSGSG
jgi:hypothetical protein